MKCELSLMNWRLPLDLLIDDVRLFPSTFEESDDEKFRCFVLDSGLFCIRKSGSGVPVGNRLSRGVV